MKKILSIILAVGLIMTAGVTMACAAKEDAEVNEAETNEEVVQNEETTIEGSKVVLEENNEPVVDLAEGSEDTADTDENIPAEGEENPDISDEADEEEQVTDGDVEGKKSGRIFTIIGAALVSALSVAYCVITRKKR